MNILELIEKTEIVYSKKASTGGGEYAGPCPWCGGTDRFGIYPARDHYVCRQCKRAGDSLQFVMEYHRKAYFDACVFLGRGPGQRKVRSKADQEASHSVIKWEPRKIIIPPEGWQKKAEAFLFQKFKFLLSNSGKKHREWLNARGIKNQTIKKARFGYNTQPIIFDRETWGLPTEKKADGKNKQVWIPAGLIIPQFYNQKIIRLRIRQENPLTQDRFIMVPGSAMGYFNYSAHLNKAPMRITENLKPSFFTEAEIDGWLVQQEAGDLVQVFAIGNASARPDVEANRIISKCPGLTNLDNDEAGRIEWPWWEKQFPKMHLWLSQKKKDPGDDYKAGVDIRAWVKAGLEKGEFASKQIAKPVTPDPATIKSKPITPKPTKPVKREYSSKACMHGIHCDSVKNGICLRCKRPYSELERCPRDAWWLYRENEHFTRVILGPGVRRF